MLIKLNNIVDVLISGSFKGVDYSKFTCLGEDIWKGFAKVIVDKIRYMNWLSTILYICYVFLFY